MDDPYEVPETPEVRIDTSNITPDEAINPPISSINKTKPFFDKDRCGVSVAATKVGVARSPCTEVSPIGLLMLIALCMPKNIRCGKRGTGTHQMLSLALS